MERMHRQQKSEQTSENEEISANKPTESSEALKAELDELLQDIDSVLENDAEEFVKNYIQKGGQ